MSELLVISISRRRFWFSLSFSFIWLSGIFTYSRRLEALGIIQGDNFKLCLARLLYNKVIRFKLWSAHLSTEVIVVIYKSLLTSSFGFYSTNSLLELSIGSFSLRKYLYVFPIMHIIKIKTNRIIRLVVFLEGLLMAWWGVPPSPNSGSKGVGQNSFSTIDQMANCDSSIEIETIPLLAAKLVSIYVSLKTERPQYLYWFTLFTYSLAFSDNNMRYCPSS